MSSHSFPPPESAAVRIVPIGSLQPFPVGDSFGTVVAPWHEAVASPVPGTDFFLGFVASSGTRVRSSAGEFTLQAGMFFAGPADVEVSGGSGLRIGGIGEAPLFLVGGPIEGTGRLRYIDGCRDSLLVPPVRYGQACLNALYFPGGTDQSVHTHPSVRVGYVVKGSGWCKLPSGRLPLQPGDVFVLPPDAVHGFVAGPDGMTVIAYHPDSDTGPTDDDHPMVNRTMIDGISASQRRERE